MNAGPEPSLARALELHRGGRLAEAERVYRSVLEQQPDNPHALHLLGLALFQQGDAAAARDLIARAVELRPEDPVMHNNLGEVLRALGQGQDAAGQYARAVQLDPAYAEPHNNLAVLMQESGRFAEARRHCEKALALRPDYADAWFNLGLARQAEGQWRDAADCYRHCARHGGESADLFNNLALCLQQQGDWDAARENYRQALLLDDSLPAALNNLAELCERAGDLEEAGALNARALAADSGDPYALLVAGRLRWRNDDEEAAAALLRRAAAARPEPNLAQSIGFELGQLLDRLGRQDEAFAILTRANALQLEDPRYRQVCGDRFLARVHACTDALRELPAERGAAADDAPAFLVGFPRSGTTLLDQILDAHPQLQVMEERPCLETVQARMEHTHGAWPGCQKLAGNEERRRLQACYRQSVDAAVQRTPGTRLVDKYPLNIIRAPLIQWLFPAAPVILSLRHPCDVVLSCFMQQFVPNDAMANFGSLDSAARAYAAVMELWELASDRFAVRAHHVRYEDLVQDFEKTVSGCLAFLGLQWAEAVGDFAAHARQRGRIATPSYRQVTHPIYHGACGRWRNYRRHFGATLEILEPFVRRYGYSLD